MENKISVAKGRKNWTDEKLFDRLLNNKSNKTHWDNIRELRSRSNKIIFRKCIEWSYSKNAKNRLIAAEVLSQLGLPPRQFIKQTIKRFFEILDIEKDKSVVSTIFYGLGHNSEYLKKKHINILCSFKDNTSIEIKQGLVFALGGIEDNKAIDTLIAFTTDKHSSIRDWATFGIAAQTDRDSLKIRAALWNRVNDKHSTTKQEAIFGLAKRKDKKIKDILKRELETIDSHGSLILEAIEEFKDKEFISLLNKKLISNRKEKRINQDWLKNTIDVLMKTK